VVFHADGTSTENEVGFDLRVIAGKDQCKLATQMCCFLTFFSVGRVVLYCIGLVNIEILF
jgi:hypothetical protein